MGLSRTPWFQIFGELSVPEEKKEVLPLLFVLLLSSDDSAKKRDKSKTEQRVVEFATTAGPSGNGGLAPYSGMGRKRRGWGILEVGEGWVGVPHRSRKAKGDGNFLTQTGWHCNGDDRGEAPEQTSFPVESVDPKLLPDGQMWSLGWGVLEQPMEIQQL